MKAESIQAGKTYRGSRGGPRYVELVSTAAPNDMVFWRSAGRGKKISVVTGSCSLKTFARWATEEVKP